MHLMMARAPPEVVRGDQIKSTEQKAGKLPFVGALMLMATLLLPACQAKTSDRGRRHVSICVLCLLYPAFIFLCNSIG